MKNIISKELDSSRLTISLGLIAIYVAVVVYLPFNVFAISYQEPLTLLFQKLLLMGWGVDSVILLFYLFLYSLKIKYYNPNTIDIMNYNIRISEKLPRILFDVGVEGYSKGIFINLVYALPFVLMNYGMKPLYAWSIFIILSLTISYILLKIEKSQSKLFTK